MYMPGLNLLDPKFVVFHANDTTSEIHFRLNAKNILYEKKLNDSTFSSSVLIQYELVDNFKKTTLDTSSILFSDAGMNNIDKKLDGVFTIRTQPNNTYTLFLIINDLNRDQYLRKSIKLNRLNNSNPQHFLLLDDNKNVLFDNFFKTNDKLSIIKSSSNNNDNIKVKFYNNNFGIAKPPFSIDEEEETTYRADTTYYINFNNEELDFSIDMKGLYHLSPTGNKENSGITLYNFDSNFPKIKSLENMIGPMRYLMAQKEYDELLQSENLKQSIDDFWISIGGSNERGRTLIREYYRRVENANIFFTSFVEGWKTDRGLIYTVYGAPNIVYKNNNYENWIYGEENNMMSLNFIFYKVNNPLTSNDFELNRSPVFKTSWYRAIDSWRNGRIY